MKKNCCQKNKKQEQAVVALKNDLDILNDANRLRILCLLQKNQQLCVCDIYSALELPQNLVSYHLFKLREAEFLLSEKQGTKVIYRCNPQKIKQFQQLLKLIF